MSSWERDANAALQALGDSYQQGGISRETYRERRRRLLAALRERMDVTERNPLHGERPQPERGKLSEAAHVQEQPAAGRRRGVLLLAAVAAVALVALVAMRWIWS